MLLSWSHPDFKEQQCLQCTFILQSLLSSQFLVHGHGHADISVVYKVKPQCDGAALMIVVSVTLVA